MKTWRTVFPFLHSAGMVVLLAAALPGPTLRAANDAPGIHVANGWIRLLPAGAPCAGYFTLENATDAPVDLTGVTVAAFRRVQVHQSYMTKDGNARMRAVPQVTVPAHGVVRFAPGGYHLMLMDPVRPLRAGETVAAELHFARAPAVRVPLVVRPADYEEPGSGRSGQER